MISKAQGEKESVDNSPSTFIARSGARAVLLVEVHPGLAAVDRPHLMGDVGERMRGAGCDAAVVVTPFMVYLVADRVVVARSAVDDEPALVFRYGALDGEGAIWNHFLGATPMLWRIGQIGAVEEGQGLVAQSHRWLATVITYKDAALRPLARGGIGLAHALLLLVAGKLVDGTIEHIEGLYPVRRP
jgi:hypothetical protein